MITRTQYLSALEIVAQYEEQNKHDDKWQRICLTDFLIEHNASKRLINAISDLLRSEVKNTGLDESLSVKEFIESFTLKQVKGIRNIGSRTTMELTDILKDHDLGLEKE
ncbi:hypothetical protein [Pedobacter jeongneungensis]|uniref:hypothetical protein n=1 Tax=Pedobacter jeongneungensis TaxID=947309 RepID=UPI000468037B|nr:hypothetical protein [Pedobacter jeongneungensis]